MTRRALAFTAVALPLCVVLSGCNSFAEIAGLATGAAAGGASANPAVGYLVAVGTAVAADETFKWISRKRHGGEQDAIAAAAGPLPQGGSADWEITHTIPIGNAHGAVEVVRAIDTPIAQCREIVFSVVDDPPDRPAHYDATICKHADRWSWANAEFAVSRWHALK